MTLFGLLKPNVKKMERREDIQGLVEALGHKKDSRVRIDAALALGRIGSHKVAEALDHALKDEDIDVKKAVEKALERVRKRK